MHKCLLPIVGLQHQNIIIFPLTPKAWKEVEVEETTTLLLFTWNGISKLTFGSGRILQWCTLVNREMVKRTMWPGCKVLIWVLLYVGLMTSSLTLKTNNVSYFASSSNAFSWVSSTLLGIPNLATNKGNALHNELSLLVNNKTDGLLASKILESPLETK